MPKTNAVVAVFESRDKAEEVVGELQRSGFDMQKLSVIGRDYQTEEHVAGCCNIGERMQYRGKLRAFWGGLWGMLFGTAFFWLPIIGPVVVAGPLVAWIVGSLESAVVTGEISVFGAALASIGIPKNSIVQYEARVKAGNFLLIAHETPDEAARAMQVLDHGQATASTVHVDPVAVHA